MRVVPLPTVSRPCIRRAGRAAFIFAWEGSRALSHVGYRGYDVETTGENSRMHRPRRLCRRPAVTNLAIGSFFLKFQFAPWPANTRLFVDDQAVGRPEISIHEGDGDG